MIYTYATSPQLSLSRLVFTKVVSLEEASGMILSSPMNDSRSEERVKKNSDQSMTLIKLESMSRSDSYISVPSHQHQSKL